MTDIDKAMLNPTAVFRTPEEVLLREDMTREQKVEVLRRWTYDARNLEVAEEENMAGQEPDILDQICRALHSLDAWLDTEHSPPTKQGGAMTFAS
ncbi:MAG: hypothetical protein O7B27_16530 [Gammaproteobacteria bacterium]|nr:hypothetical protein [Gammaproteobacteria bacterium]